MTQSQNRRIQLTSFRELLLVHSRQERVTVPALRPLWFLTQSVFSGVSSCPRRQCVSRSSGVSAYRRRMFARKVISLRLTNSLAGGSGALGRLTTRLTALALAPAAACVGVLALRHELSEGLRCGLVAWWLVPLGVAHGPPPGLEPAERVHAH